MALFPNREAVIARDGLTARPSFAQAKIARERGSGRVSRKLKLDWQMRNICEKFLPNYEAAD